VTKNAWGRASISKLQIFVFSLIVFGLLLLCVLQTGLIANISWAVLGLLGISAAGAVGGKLTYTAKRRLSLENWAWLRRRGWLPAEGDIAPRARWSDLLVDPATKEFDPYAFQMAIFSIVVAIALLRASFSGLESFAIPDQLLVLLGMSQVVFVGGQALGKGTFVELDQKLDELRVHERKYRELATKAATPGAGGSAADAEVERQAFKACAAQAAEMFWATYGEQLGSMPKALTTVESLEPEGIRAADPVMKAA
jgi:hypothetical protein